MGTLATYKAKGDFELGVVVGVRDKDVLIVTASEPKLYNQPDRKAWRDEVLSTRFAKSLAVHGFKVDIQRVPARLIQRVGRLAGLNLRMYATIADQLAADTHA